MKTKAALLKSAGGDWEIEQIDLGDPAAGEVRVRLSASGLCHSDHHLRTGDQSPALFPVLGGHEGAGVVIETGAGVSDLAEGDHVVLSFIPACGTCHMCARGLQNLCDLGAEAMTGRAISDGGFRASWQGKPVMPMCGLGAFSPYVTIHHSAAVKIDKDVPLNRAALLGCAVSTGWGSAVSIGGTRPGDTVVVVGIGGVGSNAVQGAAIAGARYVVAVDPVEFKRHKAIEFGATHTFSTLAEAGEAVSAMTWGRLADCTIITTAEIEGALIDAALAVTGKGGQVVVTALGKTADRHVQMSLFELTVLQKRVQGAMFGGIGPREQIPHLLELYRLRQLKLDELVTRTYRLEEINEGYEDMLAGRNIRGLIEYTPDDY